MFKKIRDWSSAFTTPLAEALKEALREVILAVPSLIIAFLPQFGITEKSIVGAVLYLFLRSLDKYLYTQSKQKGRTESGAVGGISPI